MAGMTFNQHPNGHLATGASLSSVAQKRAMAETDADILRKERRGES